MYITTFYSFKGGVGRTMAMVNIAAELANNGKRVLMVDFDLEAPGLDSFDLPKPEYYLGIVDFITHYRNTGEIPLASNYVYQTDGLGENGGKLWIMPSGMQDNFYPGKLNQIDWKTLYEREDGYLLMEDLKAQWERELDLDYVLIDSRTGHSDVSGICTRQLPDAVVILFFPNDQNLHGLEKIVPTIRHEAKEPIFKYIDLHFVTSNVPNLDDDAYILKNKLQNFEESLEISDIHIIHHYDSLFLLNQDIFILDRPNSRLALEYKSLCNKIIEENPKDRDGALSILEKSSNEIMAKFSPRDFELKLDNIYRYHESDNEILHLLAKWEMNLLGQNDKAMEILDKIVKIGNTAPSVYLMRAELMAIHDPILAIKDIEAAINLEKADYLFFKKAVGLLNSFAPEKNSMIPNTLSFERLDSDDKLDIADLMTASEKSLLTAEKICKDLLNKPDGDDNELKNNIKYHLSLISIALGKFLEAMEYLGPIREATEEYSMQDIFNYSIAEWGNTGEIPRDLFSKVIKLNDGNEEELNQTPNVLQCLSICYWAIGDVNLAEKTLEKAYEKALSRPTRIFSAWQYLSVKSIDFLHDLDEIKKLIKGDPVRPKFFQKNSQATFPGLN